MKVKDHLKTPPGTKLILTQSRRKVIEALFPALLVLVPLGVALTLLTGGGFFVGTFMLMVLGAWLAVPLAWRNHRRGQQLQEVVDADFRLCIRCRYSLQSLGDAGACPECGTSFTILGLRCGWEVRYQDVIRARGVKSK